MTSGKLYQLELVVKTVTWCGRPDDGKCPMTVGVRFLDNPEQTVCEVPGTVTAPCKADVTAVNAGKTFTFVVPGSCPKPVRLAVRLCRASSGEAYASGELYVTPSASCGRQTTGGDEQTVPMTDCRDGRTVAVMVVQAQAWNAGPVMATTVCCPGPVSVKPTCCPPEPTCCPSEPKPACCPPKPTCCPPKPACCPPKPACCPPKPTCCPPKPACCPPKPTCCPPKPPTTLCCPPKPPTTLCCTTKSATPCCLPEPKPLCCPTRPCRCLYGSCGRQSAGAQPQQQYTSVGCEIDGRKIDMRVRKDYETCEVQKGTDGETEDFADKVLEVVKDMHLLVMDSISTKKC